MFACIIAVGDHTGSTMSDSRLPTPLVSRSWLANQLNRPGLVILDASMKPVTAPDDEHDGAPAVRIAGARIFDFDKTICDRNSPLPHMMPSAEVFQREVRALGVSRDSEIVVYDRQGIYSSPRAWWMFRAMGHDRVAVLDGGLPAWRQAGLPCEHSAQQTSIPPGDFVARPRAGLFCDADLVARALKDPRYTVIDARPQGRFLGRDPEPRPGLRPGHMPGAVNLPFAKLVDRGHLRPLLELAGLLAPVAGSDKRLIFSCGSGVTACILALGTCLAAYEDICVYDGSWSEWGLPSSRPVESGVGGDHHA